MQEMVERTVKINTSLRNGGRMSEIYLRKGENSVKRNRKESILNSSINAVSQEATSDQDSSRITVRCRILKTFTHVFICLHKIKHNHSENCHFTSNSYRVFCLTASY